MILLRYVAIDPAFTALTAVVDDVLDITVEDVHAARAELLRWEALSSRGALHVAVMRRHGVARILTFDAGFDRVEGVQRVL